MRTLSRGKKKVESGNISHPWNSEEKSSTGIRCPKCKNDGMDGSIEGKSGQWNLTWVCSKIDPETNKPCNHRWSGGIGVQRADFSEPLPIEGVESILDDRPSVQYTGAAFRDPNKNFDTGEE